MTCTDLPDLLPHLKLNVSRNSALLPPGVVNVQSLRWGEEGEADVQVGGAMASAMLAVLGWPACMSCRPACRSPAGTMLLAAAQRRRPTAPQLQHGYAPSRGRIGDNTG